MRNPFGANCFKLVLSKVITFIQKYGIGNIGEDTSLSFNIPVYEKERKI